MNWLQQSYRHRTRLDVTSSSAKPKDVGMKLLTPPLGMSFTVIYLITPGSFYNEKINKAYNYSAITAITALNSVKLVGLRIYIHFLFFIFNELSNKHVIRKTRIINHYAGKMSFPYATTFSLKPQKRPPPREWKLIYFKTYWGQGGIRKVSYFM